MSRILMLYLASLMVRSLVIAAVTWILTLRLRNVAMRHAVWVVALFSTLLLPVADPFVPALRLPIISGENPSAPGLTTAPYSEIRFSHIPSSSPDPPRNVPSLNWWRIAAEIYGLVAGFFLLRLVLSYRTLRRLKTKSRDIQLDVFYQMVEALHIRRRVRLYQSDKVQVPLTIGSLRPVVMLPSDWQDWDAWKLRAVLSHELTHIVRGDWLVSTVAAIHGSIFWLNPVARFLERHISRLAEEACDDAAVRMTGNVSRYAEVLLQFASTHNGNRVHSGGLAMAKKSVRSRIERVLSLEQPSRGVLRSTTWALVLTAAMPVIYLASTVQNASSGPRTPVYGELLATLWGAAHPSSPVPAAKQAVEAKPIMNLMTSQDPLRQIEPEIQKLRQSPAGVDDPQSQLNTSPVNPAPVLPIQVEDGQVTLQKMMDDLKSQEQTLLRSYTAQHPMVRSLREQIEALKRQLEDLQNGTALTNKEILLDLPDNEGDLLAYLRALAEARPVIPNPERPLLSEYSDLINRTRVSSTVPFTFTLRGSAEGTYSIKASAFSGSQECGKSASCKFLIFSNGIVASEYVRFEGHPGIEVNQVLRSSTLEFTLTCRSQQCTISSIEDGRSIDQTLKINETAVFAEAAQINATVN